MNSIRREKLREFIASRHIVTIAQLAELMPDVSLMTIHRDLSFLHEQGLIEKIRGGARYRSDDEADTAFFACKNVGRGAKAAIAEKAVGLLGEAASVFIDAGTTMMAFARAIPDRRLSVVTTGPTIALELAKKHKLNITLCGGTLNKSNLTLSGTAALDTVAAINIDTAFLVASGYGEKAGFTCGMESEARIKSLVVSKARTVVMLMDSSKLERLLPYTFARMEEVDCLVTELDPARLPESFARRPGDVAII